MQRLVGTCPIVTVRVADPDYENRRETLYELAALVSICLMQKVAKIELLRSLMWCMEPILQMHSELSEQAFIDGSSFANRDATPGESEQIGDDGDPLRPTAPTTPKRSQILRPYKPLMGPATM